jgi:pimeloyl-ACP methyl ester carboxylesterase
MQQSETPGASAASPQFLELADGRRLAYHRRLPADRTRDCAGIIFIGGFRSDMTGTKATNLDRFCADRGLGYVRFDPSGHGQSSGRFVDGTIGAWAEETIAILDRVAEGRTILVGSSMGGWLMLLAALARPGRIAGLVGIAAAPDFTERLIWDRLSQEDRDRLMEDRQLAKESAYSDDPTIITRALVEEGRRHLLLTAPIGIRCPVRLLHGMADPDVPHAMSLELADRLASDDVRVTLIKDGDHRLSRETDLALLATTLHEMLT